MTINENFIVCAAFVLYCYACSTIINLWHATTRKGGLLCGVTKVLLVKEYTHVVLVHVLDYTLIQIILTTAFAESKLAIEQLRETKDTVVCSLLYDIA
jgi:hypothetical protein